MARKKNTTVNEEDLNQEEEILEVEDEYVDDGDDEYEDEDLEEETEAASTLKAGSRTVDDPKSKIEVMKAVIGAMASASSDELTKWWHQTAAQIGHEADKIPDGAASHNKDTIDAKPSDAVKESVREDLKALFDADKTLTEEARERLETIFEAAVTARVLIEREEMEACYEEELMETVEEVKSEIEDQINSYLSYCTEQWMSDNEVAIENSLRSELTEEFMEGLRELFENNFINFPESKTDVIEALAEKVEELEETLTQVIEENNELKGVNIETEIIEAIEEVAQGLTVSQTEKLISLAEDVEFDGDVDNFKNKVNIIKETYFSQSSKSNDDEEDDFEKADNEVNEDVVINDPVMKRYAEKIKQTMKEDLQVK